MVDIVKAGHLLLKGRPRYGRQHLGHAPGGAQDQFSFATANLLLGNKPYAPALEIGPLAPVIRFLEPCQFAIVGAGREARLNGVLLAPACVHLAPKGAVLKFGKLFYGWRNYLACPGGLASAGPGKFRSLGRGEAKRRGLLRPPFSKVAEWLHPQGKVRVVLGPEARWLVEPGRFFKSTWQLSAEISDMGLRLLGPALSLKRRDLVSEPVCDGTIQLTPTGPIVMMRGRQTIGGYPRIFSVILADLDILAQKGPTQSIFFDPVSLGAARSLWKKKEAALDQLAKLI